MADSVEIVYGINAVKEITTGFPGDVKEILVGKARPNPRIHGVLEEAEKHDIPVHRRPLPALTRLTGTEHHQGLVAIVKPFRYTSWEALEDRLSSSAPPLLLLLDGIQDPGNLGALLRSAALLHADAVLIPRKRAARVTPAARKAAAGAAEHIPVVLITNVARTMERLFKDHGVWWVGLDADATSTLEDVDLTSPIGIVTGGEGDGMRPLTRKRCHHLCRIPCRTTPGVDSLNASVAGAIALYEAARQRSAAARAPRGGAGGIPPSDAMGVSPGRKLP